MEGLVELFEKAENKLCKHNSEHYFSEENLVCFGCALFVDGNRDEHMDSIMT
jgi:hypothetical protein